MAQELGFLGEIHDKISRARYEHPTLHATSGMPCAGLCIHASVLAMIEDGGIDRAIRRYSP